MAARPRNVRLRCCNHVKIVYLLQSSESGVREQTEAMEMTASEEDGIIVVESDDMSVGGDRTACTEAAAAPPPISP